VEGFDLNEFVEACVAARREPEPEAAIREVLLREIREPSALEAALGAPVDPDDDGVLHRSPELFIANALFPRTFRTGIHDHGVGAVIGVWAGHEDNLLFRPVPGGVEPTGRVRVGCGDVLVLGPNDVHDVHAPRERWSAALHVYLGDITALERSSWADASAPPTPFDGERMEEEWMRVAAATGILRAPASPE